MRSSGNAIAFIDSLSALARRLAARDLVVARMHCDWRSFGSWDIEVQRGPAADAYGEALLRGAYDAAGPDVIRFFWDGKEKVLTVSSAPTDPLSSPGPWKRLLDEPCKDAEGAATFAENYVLKWAERAA